MRCFLGVPSEKFVIQASPVPACVRSAVFPDFQVSSARIPECSCVSSTNMKRTSLAGLALDSATSSGRGRAPRSAMQDPIQAPPGTTRQAGLYTS
ncbi:hypothetical protein TNCV_4531841 [Trichonephila clavipes]|nr:hypothetical protein TNCV_4531821 [Trichonephila clavipes]GFW12118.1 hypothetical protein TNCV_4531831 [Trichonephila clavipes]GFW12119.1 hypothetical protein TNCV_4531841 [Trichonephila clavipes]